MSLNYRCTPLEFIAIWPVGWRKSKKSRFDLDDLFTFKNSIQMANPTCPANCATPLPVLSFVDCGTEVNLSEIEYLLIAKPNAAVFADAESLTEWESRTSNSATTGDDSIRRISVSGGMQAAQENEITISRQRKIVPDRTFTVDAEVDETNKINYDGFRQLQCGGLVKTWLVTRSGHVFGGASGILASIKSNLQLGKGENEIQKILVTLTWKNKFYPERSLWPLAGTTDA